MIVKLISFVIIFFNIFTNIVRVMLPMIIELVSVSIVSCEFLDDLIDWYVVVKVIVGIDSVM